MEDKKKLTVLYVEDEDVNQLIFTKSFEGIFHIIIASTVDGAMEIIENKSAELDAVVSDMSMPKMSGVEFIKMAKERAPELAYYILSSYTNHTEIRQAKKEQIIRDSFDKPLDADFISSRIHEHCGS
jgi:response regulator RpfG family c-di-GMP phosphodiesterase